MADNLNIAGLIESIKKDSAQEHRDQSANHDKLASIDSRLRTNNFLTAIVAEELREQMKLTKDAMLDAKRAQDFAKKGSSPASGGGGGANVSNNFQSGEEFTNNILALPGLIMGNIIPSIVAVSAAFAGLRGWEVGAIRNIDKIGLGLKSLFPESLAKTLDQKFINTRVSIMKSFGLDPTLGAKDAETGKRALKTPVLEQINTRFRQVRTDILSRFGIGADGKAIVQRGADGKFTGKTVWATAYERIGKILNPVIKASDGVRDFFAGAGKPIADFMKNVGSKAGGFLGVVGKILKPIGFIFSAWDGITAFQNSDKDNLFEKTGDGIGAFLGDFIGAPLDLLKSGVSWILKKFFNVETDENGNAKEGQGLAGWAVTKLNSFSFEETIGGLVSGLFTMVKQGFDWVVKLFTDPTAALGELWTGITTKGGLLDILFTPINKAVDWVSKKFGWSEEDAPEFNLRDFLAEKLTSIKYTFMEGMIEVKAFFQSLPSRIAMSAEEFWENLKADFKIGLIELGDWFANLPAKILAAIVNILDKASFTIPDNAATRFFGIDGARIGFVDDETVTAANAAANAPNADSSDRIAQINASREQALQAIEDRRATAERARMQQVDALTTDVRRERAAAMAQFNTNSGGNNITNVENNYYSTTPTPGSVDPAL